jgi:hypothetical protein
MTFTYFGSRLSASSARYRSCTSPSAIPRCPTHWPIIIPVSCLVLAVQASALSDSVTDVVSKPPCPGPRLIQTRFKERLPQKDNYHLVNPHSLKTKDNSPLRATSPIPMTSRIHGVSGKVSH